MVLTTLRVLLDQQRPVGQVVDGEGGNKGKSEMRRLYARVPKRCSPNKG